MPGPPVHTDLIEVYVFRRRTGPSSAPGQAEFLQLHRAGDGMLAGTWQPVMGHVEPGESAAGAAVRELEEETGFTAKAGGALRGFWQLETPNTYFLHRQERIVISPGFAAEVEPRAEPTLDPGHDQRRWFRRDEADRAMLWPGQAHAVTQITRDLLPPGSPTEPILRIDPTTCLSPSLQ